MGPRQREHPPLPLQIVLGALLPGQHTLSKQEQDSSSTCILSTSYYDVKYKKLNKDGRVDMEDRKGPFDHFRPKALVLSVSALKLVYVRCLMSVIHLTFNLFIIHGNEFTIYLQK